MVPGGLQELQLISSLVRSISVEEMAAGGAGVLTTMAPHPCITSLFHLPKLCSPQALLPDPQDFTKLGLAALRLRYLPSEAIKEHDSDRTALA